ncbi:MAG: O-antigen ligase family protein [Planctomycetota bacterium]|nr:O-antigen ligase family protein [Planctomycetota bacterium]
MIWLLIGYMYLYIHRPFEIWPWIGELRVERIYMLITIVFWAAFAEKKWTRNCINMGVLVFAVSFTLSTVFSRYVGFGNLGVQDWYKVLVFYILVMTSINQPRDFRRLIVGFVLIAGIYELHSLYEDFNGRGVSRMGTWRMVGVNESLADPNSLAATTNTFIPLLLPLTVFAKDRWQKLSLAGLLVLFVVVIFFTGSRSGFLALVALGLGITFIAVLGNRYRWRVLPLLILPFLAWGFLPDDLQKRYRTIIDPSAGPANAQRSADSRVDFFWAATRVWNREPVFGVGPGGFKTASGMGRSPHSLYAQVISDLGSVGVLALLALITCFGFNFWQTRKIFYSSEDDPWLKFHFYVVAACGIAVLQLLLLGFAGHNLLRFTWIWYAAFSALGFQFASLRRNELMLLAAEGEEPNLAVSA